MVFEKIMRKPCDNGIESEIREFMPKPLTLTLKPDERSLLQKLVNSHPKAYLRQRAAALLKIADGDSVNHVAHHGLLRRFRHKTVSTWLKRYQTQGFQGLLIKAGRGRKPAFQPHFSSPVEAQEALLHTLNRSPEDYVQSGTRWTLEALAAACDWLQLKSGSGLHRLLKRLKIHYKRGRLKVHSPDPQYVEKLADICRALQLAKASQGKIVLLFADQLTIYRQPSLANAYGLAGRQLQPLAQCSHHSNTAWRIGGLLNGVSGKVTFVEGYKVGRRQLVELYEKARQEYAEAEVIYIVLDNWPVHFHADVIAELQPQQTPFALNIPASWSRQPSTKVKELNLPLQLLPLPTYASWCNPIEKLWKHLKQKCLHLHRWSADWEELKKRLREHLEQFTGGSEGLLRYVGLTTASKLYGAILAVQPVPT
jgi:transposase